jgi:hypothetical protein
MSISSRVTIGHYSNTRFSVPFGRNVCLAHLHTLASTKQQPLHRQPARTMASGDLSDITDAFGSIVNAMDMKISYAHNRQVSYGNKFTKQDAAHEPELKRE